jgi:nucleotide-binding universal stress UspA family protein
MNEANAPYPLHVKSALVCTDGSPASLGAVQAGLSLSRATGCIIHLLEVVEFIPYYEYAQPEVLLIPPALGQEILKVQEAAVSQRLEAWKSQPEAQGVHLETQVRVGAGIFAEITAAVEEIKPDLVIMGRRGVSGLARLLLGSTTARVIGHSPVNVLVVPRDASLSYANLLVASDGSPFSAAAWEEALRLYQPQAGTLTAVVVAHGDLTAALAADLLANLTNMAAARGVTLQTLSLAGRPYEAILKAAGQTGATLLILGSHGRTGLTRLLMGSVAERVIGQAPCPVLVVKRQETAAKPT